MQVYSLFDRKLREYGGLVLMPNDASCKRALHEGLSSNSTVGKYPEDYDLMLLGEFDPLSGVIKPGVIVLVDNVADILRRGNSKESSDAISTAR